MEATIYLIDTLNKHSETKYTPLNSILDLGKRGYQVRDKFKFETIDELKKELRRLQKSYSEDGPIYIFPFKSDDGKNLLVASCDSDFSYMAKY